MYCNMKLFLIIVISALINNAKTVCAEKEIGLSAHEANQARLVYELEKDQPLAVSSLSRSASNDIRFSVEQMKQMREHTTINATVRLWSDGVVPYAISDELRPTVRIFIAMAIDYFHRDTCVCWVPRSVETDYVLFTPNGVGCSSDVGFQANGTQTVVLADIGCISKVGDVLHFMLHVVGLHHEHQRIDRDQWINVNLTNVIDGHQEQFHKIATNLTEIGESRYDYSSLMHYGRFDGAVDWQSSAIEPKPHGICTMGQRTRLSEGDIEKMHLLYGNNCQKNNCQITTTDAATHRCILLIGGLGLDSVPSIEYYHPIMSECNVNAIGRMSTSRLNDTYSTSGCYLSDAQTIVIRETSINKDKPSLIYGLRDSSVTKLPALYKHSSELPMYTIWSTAASINSSHCISCGGQGFSPLGSFGVTYPELHECYQFNSLSPARWTSMPSLPRAVVNAASVSLGNDSYYVIGGGRSLSKQLFRYSVSERRWYEETPMAGRRRAHSAAALSSTEFITCGGLRTGNHCEVYNAAQKKWRRVGNLTIGRYQFALVNFNQRVYALGGFRSDYSSIDEAKLNSVEEYDGQTEEWMVVKNLKYVRRSFFAVVV